MNILISKNKYERKLKSFFSAFLILGFVFAQVAMPLSVAYAQENNNQQNNNHHQDDDKKNNDDHEDSDKLNICHKTESENHPWNAIQINSNSLQTHLGHGDFLYEGPVKDHGDDKGKPKDGNDWCKDHAPQPPVDLCPNIDGIQEIIPEGKEIIDGDCVDIVVPPSTANVIATKVVCDAETDLPDWGAGGPDITSTTASDYVASHPSCHIEPWTFEWALDGNSNPGNSVGVAGGAWTAFSSGSPVEVPVGSLIWVREQFNDDYIPFSGNTDPKDPISAELYCHTDVLNYDNYDWIDPVVAGESYDCVAFNVLKAPVQQCIDEPNGSWADAVVSSSQGKRKDGSNVVSSRSDTNLALGPSDWTSGGSTGFYSLGFGGSITLSFDSFVPDVPGADIFIHEATNTAYPLEKVNVEVSQDGNTWELAGTADNTTANKITEIDFSGTSFSWIKFIRMTDISNPAIFQNDADGFDLDAVMVAKQVCDEPQNEPQTSTVTMCKTDDSQPAKPLSGWQLMLSGSSVGSINVLPNGNEYKILGVPAGNYLLKASGQYTYRGTSGAEYSDAAYSKRDPSDSVYGGPFVPWVRENDFPNPLTGWLGIIYNNAFTDWGSIFNPSHEYVLGTSTGSLGDMSFKILDDKYGDNSGHIAVSVEKGYTGVTDQNGCVVFNDVPYGQYTVDEVAQDGWSNVSGLQDVLIDEPEETFTVVNHNDSIIEEPTTGSIEITKYVCPVDTSVVRSANGVDGTVPDGCELQEGKTFGYVHGEQTDANSPYPELDENLTEGGSTDVDGKLIISDLDPTGRYLVAESDGNGNKLSAGDILGLYCEGDGDTSDNNDNQELTFVTAGEATHCVAYNKAPIITPPSCPATYTDDSDNSGAIRFESDQGYSTGSIDGQNGWSATGPYDYGVVSNTYGYPSFDDQTFRISDAITSGSFGDWAFVAPVSNGAGEVDSTPGTFSTGTLQNHFEAQFDIASTDPCSEQEGLHISVSPDRGDGSRMSYLRFEDNGSGLDVFFDDVSGTGPISFDETQIASGLNRSIPHKIKFVMDFVDGPSNDVVQIYIDGSLVHTGTSWENYYRYDSEASAEQSPRIVKTLIFQARGDSHPANIGKGYLIDNVSLSSSVPAEEILEEDCSEGYHQEGESCVPDTPPSVPSNQSFGGGGGGGLLLFKNNPEPEGEVLGASTSCGVYLDDFLKIGKKNNKEQVKKLQTFLNDYLHLSPKIKVDGVFGLNTFKAVVKFQESESDLVLKPWVGLTLKDAKKGTGWVYKTTLTRINNIMCPDLNLGIPPLTI